MISEPLRREPAVQVVEWIDAQHIEALYLSTITIAGLRTGVAILSPGKRRNSLRESLEKQVLLNFSGRVLAFELGCTHAYADVMAKAREAGLAIATANGYIAAIAAANGLTVATRDIGPFEAVGVLVINPWSC